jgi:hypothetical protein
MSTGADAMGVAAWLTPALIVAVAAGLAYPAVGRPADPAPPVPAPADPAPANPAPLATADRAELLDPDCDPAEAEKADPLLVEEPDGVCAPDQPAGRAETAPQDPAPNPGSEPDAPTAAADPSQPVAEAPATLAPLAPKPRRAPGARRRPAPTPDPLQPKRRPAERHREAGPQYEVEPQRDTHARERRRARERAHNARERAQDARERAQDARERAQDARERARIARERAHGSQTSPLARFPRAALDTPEPLARARRLKPGFARRLERVAERFRVPWELLLAVRRSRGHDGSVPASSERLRLLARRLVLLGARKNPRRAVRRLARAIALRADSERPRPIRRRALVRRVVALAHLNKAIGLRGLVRGLKRVKRRLARQVLESSRLQIYAGGRHDIRTGFTDVRVLVLLRYLSSRYREVTVTSLTTGHSFFTASGNVSAHSYGQAVDIAALNGRPILGNQEPGGLTEQALNKILLLPGSLEPSQLISLFELGGPSFAMADHADHIHVGY